MPAHEPDALQVSTFVQASPSSQADPGPHWQPPSTTVIGREAMRPFTDMVIADGPGAVPHVTIALTLVSVKSNPNIGAAVGEKLIDHELSVPGSDW